MSRSFTVFRLIIVVLLISIFTYTSQQITRYANLDRLTLFLTLTLLAIPFILFSLFPLILITADRKNLKPWHKTATLASYYGMAYLSLILFLVVTRDLFSFAFFAIGKTTDHLYQADSISPMMGLPLLLMLLGRFNISRGPRVHKITIHDKKLDPALDGLTIAQISDVHIGHSMPAHFIEKIKDKLNHMQADIVCATGDILDGNPELHTPELSSLTQVKAKYGKFFVSGNHEYYWDAGRCVPAMESTGFHITHNQTVILKIQNVNLKVSGVPDPTAQMFGQESMRFESLDYKTDGYHILLCHQPKFADLAKQFKIDLQLSGHTHSGQFIPWSWLIFLFQKYSKGLYQLDNLKLYVNQGTGYWGPPLRIGTFCEITHITLKRD